MGVGAPAGGKEGGGGGENTSKIRNQKKKHTNEARTREGVGKLGSLQQVVGKDRYLKKEEGGN